MEQKLLEKNDVNLEKIHDILNNAFIQNTLDKEEKRIIINIDDRNVLFTLKEDKQLATLSLLSIQKEQKEEQFLKIISALNEINNSKIFIRASALQSEDFILIVFDFEFRYSFGFNIPQFIDDLRLFTKLIENYLPILLPVLND